MPFPPLRIPGAVVCALIAPLPPALSLADDASRISRLESELQQLRIRIDEQSRRIDHLEGELLRRSGQEVLPASAESKRPRDTGQAPVRPATEPAPWHSVDAWKRIEKGMAESQVISILGSPTSIESLEPFRTLFYRGLVHGGKQLAGHVNLRDGRVVAVRQPEF